MDKKYKYLIVILLIVFSFIAFGRIIGNDFINFDDNVYITENNHIKAGLNSETIKWAFSAVFFSNWHPLTLISHALDWSLFGASASGHHLINLLLHIGSVLFLFFFLEKTTKSFWPSAFVAAFFALHPLRVESVAWAAERKDVLSMLFGMTTIYVYALYVEEQKLARYFLCLALFALGLMAKPMLVTLPFVLMLLDFWPLGRWQKALAPANVPVAASEKSEKKKTKQRIADSTKEKKISTPLASSSSIIRSLLWEKAPFIFLAMISSIVTIWAQSKEGAVVSVQKLPFPERVVNAIISYISYLGKIFWPVDLAVFYPYEYSFQIWQILGAILLLLGISAAVIYAIKKTPFLFVGWFWYLGTLVPVIGLVQVGRQAMADRYTYLSSIGIAIMLAWGIVYLLPKEKLRKIILIPAAVIVLSVLTFLTWQQSGYWKNSVSLFNHALEATKNNYMAHIHLGIALAAEGKIDEAVSHYRTALQVSPNDDITHYNLANALKKQGADEEAIAHYQEALRINPNYSEAHNNLGIILEAQLKHDEAIYHYRQALQFDPNNPGVHFNLGIALGRKGALKEAIESFRTAIYLNPNYEEARRVLRLALELEQGRRR
jgi:tetratricopeptide (TPR) repeat protein